jgi:hypothetical protein
MYFRPKNPIKALWAKLASLKLLTRSEFIGSHQSG